MRCLLLLSCVSMATALHIHCEPDNCLPKYATSKEWVEFYVKGPKQREPIQIEDVDTHLHINCNTVKALEWLDSLPTFVNEFQVSEVKLTRCPLPTLENVTIVDAIKALNAKLEPKSGEISLTLLNFPHDEKLTAHQFDGFDKLTNFTMTYSTIQLPEDLFTKLPNLHSLSLHGEKLPSSGLDSLPRSLKHLNLNGESSASLPKTIPKLLAEIHRVLPNLVTLTVTRHWNIKEQNKTITIINEPSSLETLRLYHWTEQRLEPFNHCDNLRIFETTNSQVRELPERLVAACPLLEELIIDRSSVGTLPEKLLEGATALKRIALLSGAFNSLPEGLFQGAPNLISINLGYNGLYTLPSGLFSGLTQLRALNLRQNRLGDAVLSDLAKLTQLTDLDLSYSDFSKFCDRNGDSPFINLVNLKHLDLSQMEINTTICRDWREKLVHLERLNLETSFTTCLEFADFQFKRDLSVKNSVVDMGGSEIIVNFTEDDYKKALTAPATDAVLSFENDGTMNYSHLNRKCDCRMYWLRKAIQDASQAIKIERLRCGTGGYLEKMSLQILCPERAT